jgi:hypothetical protein
MVGTASTRDTPRGLKEQVMANEGILEISLLDVTGAEAIDPDTRLTVKRGSSQDVVSVFRTSFPPTRYFSLPAFPSEHVLAPFIEPSRYRSKPLPFFTLTSGKTIVRQVTVFRKPSDWHPAFTKWLALSDRFDPLRKVLEESGGLRVRGAASLEDFTGGHYDRATDDGRVVLPKASMLNLFAKLTELREPINKRKPWFHFVRQLLEIGRERFIAVVDTDMADRIRTIRDRIDDFAGVYKRTPVGDHHQNLPAAYAVAKNSMVSIKTTEANGNVQLTVGKGTDPESGDDVWLLDTDIDENGKLLVHLGDLFKHRFTGGTHPIDIHEYLALAHPGIDLGYVLAPAPSVRHVARRLPRARRRSPRRLRRRSAR